MTYEALAAEIGRLVEEKQAAYGSSFTKSGEIFRVLYPNGIAPEQMDDALALVRIVDKLFRIATARDAFGESPARDIAGYALLMAARHGEESVPCVFCGKNIENRATMVTVNGDCADRECFNRWADASGHGVGKTPDPRPVCVRCDKRFPVGLTEEEARAHERECRAPRCETVIGPPGEAGMRCTLAANHRGGCLV
jgi:hypothetical protein